MTSPTAAPISLLLAHEALPFGAQVRPLLRDCPCRRKRATTFPTNCREKGLGDNPEPLSGSQVDSARELHKYQLPTAGLDFEITVNFMSNYANWVRHSRYRAEDPLEGIRRVTEYWWLDTQIISIARFRGVLEMMKGAETALLNPSKVNRGS
jgi:hypothetical protein